MTPHIGNTLDRLSFIHPNRKVILGTQTKDPSKVDTTSVGYDEMWVDWELIEDLCTGRDQMILKSVRWLPQEPGEEPDKYEIRLYRSFLFGGFSDTLEKLASKPFSREVVVRNEERLPEQLQDMVNNVDLQGTTLTAFSKNLLRDGIKYGHGLVFVDYPEIAQNLGGEPLTFGDELERKIRPYFIRISPSNLLGWRSEFRDGKEFLTEIRYREDRLEARGAFGDEKVEVIRVVTAPQLTREQIAELGEEELPDEMKFGTVQEWKRASDRGEEFEKTSSRFHTYPGIPLVWLPLNPSGKGLLQSTPPLRDLAELNLEHWQKGSDNSNILRFVAIAMVLLSGVDEGGSTDEEATGGPDELVWGVNQFIKGPQGADGKYIEHTGQGIGALQNYISKIEERMETLGMQPLMARQVDVTATSQRKDDQKVTSSLQSWIRRLETTLHWAFFKAAVWIGEEESLIPTGNEATDLAFDVFSEFGLRVVSRDDSEQLLSACNDKKISLELFLTEWQKRGIIGEEVIIKEEVARIVKLQEEAANRTRELRSEAPADENEEAGLQENAAPAGG